MLFPVKEIKYEIIDGKMSEILVTHFGELLSTNLFPTPTTFIALGLEKRSMNYVVSMDTKTKKFYVRSLN